MGQYSARSSKGQIFANRDRTALARAMSVAVN